MLICVQYDQFIFHTNVVLLKIVNFRIIMFGREFTYGSPDVVSEAPVY